jgi:2-oxo-3-hexenedioate decarboxylase
MRKEIAVDAPTIEGAAGELLARESGRRDGGRLSDDWPELDPATAYRVQDAVVRRKIDAGETLVGVKLGLTSRAKQERMGIDSPLTAWLTDGMRLAPGAPLPLAELIHPRVEPEIVFELGERLSGPGVTAETALKAVANVRAGFEVIDSRYADFGFTLPDVVADNASASRFVLSGTVLAPGALDLVREECVLEVDGETVATATGAAVQGDPAQALALAANDLGARGVVLEPGWIVMTGGLTDAVTATRGSRIGARFSRLGSLLLEAR